MHDPGPPGMDSKTEAEVQSAFKAANAETGNQWTLVEGDEAEYVVVDMDSLYGPMSWLRLHAAGRKVIGLTSVDRNQTDFRLPRPISANDFTVLLSEIAVDAPVEAAAAKAAAVAAATDLATAPTANRPPSTSKSSAPDPIPAPERRLCCPVIRTHSGRKQNLPERNPTATVIELRGSRLGTMVGAGAWSVASACTWRWPGSFGRSAHPRLARPATLSRWSATSKAACRSRVHTPGCRAWEAEPPPSCGAAAVPLAWLGGCSRRVLASDWIRKAIQAGEMPADGARVSEAFPHRHRDDEGPASVSDVAEASAWPGRRGRFLQCQPGNRLRAVLADVPPEPIARLPAVGRSVGACAVADRRTFNSFPVARARFH